MKTSKIISSLAWGLMVVGFVCLMSINFYLIFTDPEYAKHDSSAYAMIELIKDAWWAVLMFVLGFFTWITRRCVND